MKNIKNNNNENKETSKNTTNSKNKIPEELKDFYSRHYTVMMSNNGVPKEFSALGDGFKSERVCLDDLTELSKETLVFIALHKNPDYIVKNFRSGGLGTF